MMIDIEMHASKQVTDIALQSPSLVDTGNETLCYLLVQYIPFRGFGSPADMKVSFIYIQATFIS